MDDALDLVKRSQAGDQAAFKELVNLHNGQVFGQILRMVRDNEEAKEIAQQTWIKVWNKLGSFRFESAFSSWLYRVATFTALDAIRKRKSRKEVSLLSDDGDEIVVNEPSAVAPPDQIANMERQEIRERFMKALDSLPNHHKEALILRENEGLSYKEIARKMKCKTGTVMSRIFNARKAIQNQMKEFIT